ncbi:F-box protein CPR1-like [Coffea eugenioides]|uniref:F-box protein CPR1-like n=1 Tax=Coffea eugenioides TaxID=49369 RepID=UPI000F60678B|nr:F-box protein CPR1-like [Coffea eugenioides]
MVHVHIPEEIIVEILSRLPVKSILQFKLVCKLWNSLLYDPRFSLATKGRERAMFWCCGKRCFSSLDDQYAIEEIPRQCWYRPYLDFLGSCNGLVLFSTYETWYCYYNHCNFYLLNPSTRSFRGLINFSGRMLFGENRITYSPVAYGLCFDKLSDDYKVVMVYYSSIPSQRALVVSLKRGTTLREVSLPYKLRGTAVLATGNLHWIDKNDDLIVCFDETTNRFSKLPTPAVVRGGNNTTYRLGILDGCLCMSRYTAGIYTSKCELFVMEEYGVKESWATLCAISGGANLSSVSGWEPLFYTKSGEELLISGFHCILAYNVKTKSLKEIHTYSAQESYVGPLRYEESEEPYKHLQEFDVVCNSMKPPGITEEQIKMRAFPFSLKDSAKDWLYYLPPGSITTWDQLKKKFLDKYFPASRAASLRKEICGIKQHPGESLYEYWERFKKLCTKCPQHQIRTEA